MMRRRIWRGLGALVALGVFYAWNGQRAELGVPNERARALQPHITGDHPSRQAKCRARGKVGDAKGAPLVSAIVCATCANCILEYSRAACVATGPAGTFEFPDLRAGDFWLTASARGFIQQRGATAVALRADRCEAEQDFRLRAGGAAVLGSVSDALGGPIAGAHVRLVDSGAGHTAEVQTDDSGRFEAWTGEGRFSVVAEASGYVTAHTSTFAPTDRLHLSLLPAATLAGTVVSHRDGRPIAGALVRAVGADYVVAELGDFAVSDESGRFVIPTLAPNLYTVIAEASGFRLREPVAVSLELAESLQGVTLALEPAVRVEGQLVMRSGDEPCRGSVDLEAAHDRAAAAAGVSPVSIALPGTPGLPGPRAWTDTEGRFAFAAVSPGRYIASFDCPGYRPGQQAVEVHDKDITDLRWQLETSPRLEVRVQDPRGQPLANVSIVVERVAPRSAQNQVLPESDGRFVLDSIEPGDYTVAVASAAERELGRQQFVVRPDDGLVKVLVTTAGSARLRVQISCGSDRRCGALEVTAVHQQSGHELYGRLVQEDTYVFQALQPGAYVVYANDGANPRPRERVELSPGADVAVSLRFDTPARIRGRVVDEDGAPVMNAWVAASPPNGSPEVSGVFSSGTLGPRAVTNAAGEFEITGLDPNALYQLSANARDYPGAVLESAKPGQDVTFTLPLPVTLSGYVVDAEGKPVEHFSLHSTVQKTMETLAGRFQSRTGQWQLAGIAPGDAWVTAMDAEGRTGSVFVQVRPRVGNQNIRVKLAPSVVAPTPTTTDSDTQASSGAAAATESNKAL